MALWLTYISLAVVLIVVLALVVYLVAIILALRSANSSLNQLAGGLGQIMHDTDPLADKMKTINGALGQLLNGLVAVDGDLAAVANLVGEGRT